MVQQVFGYDEFFVFTNWFEDTVGLLLIYIAIHDLESHKKIFEIEFFCKILKEIIKMNILGMNRHSQSG